jgi:acyl-CoA reductase-like NAD-dependent aldehyde dehydrogenase
MLIDCVHSDYYAALLRTTQGIVAPTQGPLLNYIQRIPLGVVAQITVCVFVNSDSVSLIISIGTAIQPSVAHLHQENRTRACCRKFRDC